MADKTKKTYNVGCIIFLVLGILFLGYFMYRKNEQSKYAAIERQEREATEQLKRKAKESAENAWKAIIEQFISKTGATSVGELFTEHHALTYHKEQAIRAAKGKVFGGYAYLESVDLRRWRESYYLFLSVNGFNEKSWDSFNCALLISDEVAHDIATRNDWEADLSDRKILIAFRPEKFGKPRVGVEYHVDGYDDGDEYIVEEVSGCVFDLTPLVIGELVSYRIQSPR